MIIQVLFADLLFRFVVRGLEKVGRSVELNDEVPVRQVSID